MNNIEYFEATSLYYEQQQLSLKQRKEEIVNGLLSALFSFSITTWFIISYMVFSD